MSRTLRVFGTVALTDGARPLTGPAAQRQSLALLALIAANHRHGISREKVATLLWPDSTTEQARNRLKQALHVLRREIHPDVVIGVNDIRLGVEVLACDLADFDRLIERGEPAAALEKYGGPFLDGFHLGGDNAEEFERWTDEQRDRIARQASGAMRGLALDATAHGDYDRALGWWRRLAEGDPLDTRYAREVIATLMKLGDAAGALRHAEAHRALIRAELALQPDGEFEALVARIRIVAPGSTRIPTSPDREPEKAATEPQLPPPNALRRRPRVWPAASLPAFLIIVTGALLATLVVQRQKAPTGGLVPDVVLVAPFENRTGDTTLDALGGLAADWITMGIQETALAEVIDPATSFVYTRSETGQLRAPDTIRIQELARKTGAMTVVWGAYDRNGDSLSFAVRLTDASRNTNVKVFVVSGAVASIPVLVQELRARVAGALASHLDPRLATLITASSVPPRLESYDAYTTALGTFIDRLDYSAAADGFLRAADFDTSFVLPRIWAIIGLLNAGRRVEGDSLIRSLAARRSQLLPLDRYALDYFVASDRNSRIASLRAATRLAPRSNWPFILAGELGSDYPHESIRLLEALDPNGGWVRGWPPYWSQLADGYHYVRDYEKELSTVRRATRWNPYSHERLVRELRIHAALGHTADVRALLEKALEQWDGCGAGRGARVHCPYPDTDFAFVSALELRAHGHTREALRLMAFIQELRPLPAFAHDSSFAYASFIEYFGWDSAAEALRDSVAWLTRHPEHKVQFRFLEVLKAVESGNVTRGASIAATMFEGARRDGASLYVRAQLAAMLGEKEGAVKLLQEMRSSGEEVTRRAHRSPAFDSLRDYPPFIALLRPLG